MIYFGERFMQFIQYQYKFEGYNPKYRRQCSNFLSNSDIEIIYDTHPEMKHEYFKEIYIYFKTQLAHKKSVRFYRHMIRSSSLVHLLPVYL